MNKKISGSCTRRTRCLVENNPLVSISEENIQREKRVRQVREATVSRRKISDVRGLFGEGKAKVFIGEGRNLQNLTSRIKGKLF